MFYDESKASRASNFNNLDKKKPNRTTSALKFAVEHYPTSAATVNLALGLGFSRRSYKPRLIHAAIVARSQFLHLIFDGDSIRLTIDLFAGRAAQRRAAAAAAGLIIFLRHSLFDSMTLSHALRQTASPAARSLAAMVRARCVFTTCSF